MYNNIIKRTKASSLNEQIEIRQIELELIKQLKIVTNYLNGVNFKKKYTKKSKKRREYDKFTPDIKLIKKTSTHYVHPRKMIRIHKNSRPMSYYPPGFPPTPIGFKGYPCDYYKTLYT